MRVLLVKTSSMGDLIHTLPALTDAAKAIPGIQFDWLVEDNFIDIPSWHSSVNQVIPVALRRWRKGIFSEATRSEWGKLRQQLKDQHYDLILDAQGLVKSAILTYFAHGKRAGLDWNSARESLASLAYQQKYTVNFYQHAIVRMRSLFSLALGYPLPQTLPDYGLDRRQFKTNDAAEKYIVFLHGTSFQTKLWPENYWVQLAKLAAQAGYHIKIGGGTEEELARAKRIASQCSNAEALPRLNIPDTAKVLANAQAVVAVDTGFGHLAAALDVPTVSLYGPTNPEYTGALGASSVHLAADFPCAPCLSRVCQYREPSEESPACFTTVKPERVWAQLQKSFFAR